MNYSNIVQGEFISRPNRFIAEVIIEGRVEICHVKNTGRLKELLVEHAEVYLEKSLNPSRKTAFSLIGVKKGGRIINIDSQAPNKVFYESLSKREIDLPGLLEPILIKPEKKYGNSRFDFYVGGTSNKAYIEVKGVTLEENGIAKFPDAPTERGLKHVKELVRAKNNEFEAFLVFIIQLNGIKYFTPNDETHKEFGDALRHADKNGVKIFALECDVGADSIKLNGKRIKVVLQ